MIKLTKNERRAIMLSRKLWKKAREAYRIPRGLVGLTLASDLTMAKNVMGDNKLTPAVGRCIAYGTKNVVSSVVIELSRRARGTD